MDVFVKTFRTALDQCPVCKHEIDAAQVYATSKRQQQNPPKEGDYTVCINCTSVLRFELSLRLRVATRDDLDELHTNQPETFALLEQMTAAAKEIVRESRRKKRRWH